MAKRLLGGLVAALALSATVYCAYFDFEQLTIDNTSGGVKLTAAKVTPNGFVYVSCRLRTAEISYLTVDPTKTTVTASVGQLLEPGEILTITDREQALNLRMIRTGATSAQADCSYKYTQAP